MSGTWASTLLATVKIGLLALGNELLGQADAEEVFDDRNAFCTGGGGGTGRGLDPGARNIARFDILQQVAVVSGDLHHMAAGI